MRSTFTTDGNPGVVARSDSEWSNRQWNPLDHVYIFIFEPSPAPNSFSSSPLFIVPTFLLPQLWYYPLPDFSVSHQDYSLKLPVCTLRYVFPLPAPTGSSYSVGERVHWHPNNSITSTVKKQSPRQASYSIPLESSGELLDRPHEYRELIPRITFNCHHRLSSIPRPGIHADERTFWQPKMNHSNVFGGEDMPTIANDDVAGLMALRNYA